MGKISEYASEAVIGTSSDLLDISKFQGGTAYDSQKITPNSIRKDELLINTFSAARNFNLQNAPVQEMPIEGDCTLSISNTYNGGMFNLFLKADATPRTVTLDSSFGTLRGGFAPLTVTEAGKVYLVQVIVDASGNKSYGIESY